MGKLLHVKEEDLFGNLVAKVKLATLKRYTCAVGKIRNFWKHPNG